MPPRSGLPLVSCIVPVFNGERFLAAALDSIFAQTWRPIEVIVVDDGSTDRSPAIVARYADRLTCVRQENAGPAAARNCGLEVAQGEFVAFLDADDLWYPDKLTRQMARFTARPNIEMCVSHGEVFWEKEGEDEARRMTAADHPWLKPGLDFCCQALLVRRTVFDRTGNFDVALRAGEDTDWYARTAEQGIIRDILPEVLWRRRRHRGNLTLSVTKQDWLDIFATSLKRKRRDPAA